MILDVFEELGFIRAKGAERTIVETPPKRQLEESARYRRAVAAEAANLSSLTLDRLRDWFESQSWLANG